MSQIVGRGLALEPVFGFYVLGEIGPVAGVSCKFDDFVKGNLVKVPGVEDQGS